MNRKHPIATYINPFFSDYLSIQRGLSENTIFAYRDSLKLLFCFAAEHYSKSVDALTVEELNEELILAFLDNIEKHRKATAKTRNARLAAIRTFFRFIAREEPLLIQQCQRVRSLPQKKEVHKLIDYLENSEMKAMLASINLSSRFGARDKALLLLMFNTGARAQELADLRIDSLRLDSCGQVKIMGKGKKQRSSPLWQETVDALKLYLQTARSKNSDDNPYLFLNNSNLQISRFGISYIVKKYAKIACIKCPSIGSKKISPHTFRHSTAMHLIQSGNDINMVSMWLGHADINTTHVYLEIDIEMKRKMLEKASPPECQNLERPKPWKNNQILTWLDSLSSNQTLC